MDERTHNSAWRRIVQGCNTYGFEISMNYPSRMKVLQTSRNLYCLQGVSSSTYQPSQTGFVDIPLISHRVEDEQLCTSSNCPHPSSRRQTPAIHLKMQTLPSAARLDGRGPSTPETLVEVTITRMHQQVFVFLEQRPYPPSLLCSHPPGTYTPVAA